MSRFTMFIILLILISSKLQAKEYFVSEECKKTNCTKTIQKAIDSKKYTSIIFPNGEFLLNSLNLKSNLLFMAKTKQKTSLIFIKLERPSFLNIEGENNITIKNFTFKNLSTKSIINIDGKKIKASNISIYSNVFLNYAEKDSIELKFDVNNIDINNNKMYYYTSMEAKKDWKQICHIKYRGKVSNKNNNYTLKVNNNHLEGGNCGFRIVTKGLPLSHITFKNNYLTNQNSNGVSFYHARDANISNNKFENIIATSMKNNDGGVVWLDRYRNGQIRFENNIIQNCKGNAIFVEELKDSIIINNKIVNIKKRDNDKFKHSVGGNGILLTNLKSLTIESNFFEDIYNQAILIDSKIGVPHDKEVKKVSLKKNTYKNTNQISIKDLRTKIHKEK